MTTDIQFGNPASIKAYFEKVRQLAKSGEQYPVNLDEVWPLVYTEKIVAVRALRKSFFEHEDYVLLDQNVEQKKRGGHNEKIYQLTVACMEYFIARKVRGVFNVYRQVFQAVIEQVEQASLPPTQMELLVQSLQANIAVAEKMVETERRVASLELRLEQIEVVQKEAQVELLALPAPGESLPELLTEDKIKKVVNAYARAKSITQQEVWRLVYNELYYRYHISVNNYRLNPGESKLQRLKQTGHLDKVWLIATTILRVDLLRVDSPPATAQPQLSRLRPGVYIG